ncbi:MAG: cation transporting ATPase C-terminal domain-containing protein, partial [Ruminiclostridium sp.]|nr:cation transporting ATPase C-terminal domain-containing protein [Ruminiclostridium sp.]
SMFMGNNADLKSDFISSAFIGKGVINSSFFPKILILGGMLAVAQTLFYLFTLSFEPSIHRAFLVFMTAAGLTFIGFSLISRKRSFFTCVKEQKGFSGTLQSGILLLVSLVLIYIPYLNSAFGFSAPNVLVLLISLLVTALFTLWPEAAKKFNSVQ